MFKKKQKKNKNPQQATHRDIYWSPEYEEFPCDSQQPSHKNDLLCQMQQHCNLHTHNPGNDGGITINDSWLYHIISLRVHGGSNYVWRVKSDISIHIKQDVLITFTYKDDNLFFIFYFGI